MMTGSRVTLGLPRSAVLYCALLALSCVTPLHADTSNDGHVTVNVKRFIYAIHSSFEFTGQYAVGYSSTESYCVHAGAVLASDQSEAMHKRIQFYVDEASSQTDGFCYLGGDASWSASDTFELHERCTAGTRASSRHCVYRWNKGLFASTSPDGHGIPFWRGSLFFTEGTGPLNNYPSFWPDEYPARGELFTLFWYKAAELSSSWYDATDVSGLDPFASQNPGTITQRYVIVCEVHDSISTTTTSTTTTTSSPTPEAPAAEVTSEPTATAGEEVETSPSSFWTLRDWRSILLVSLLLGAVVVLLLAVVCCCCRCCSGGDGAKETSPMTLRETVGERGFAVMPMSVVPHRDFHDDSPSAEHYGQMGSSKTL